MSTGDKVYCYKHSDSHYSYMTATPCGAASTPSWKTIVDRFGQGIPSNPDDVIPGAYVDSTDFYFFKDNMVYKSVGDLSVGSLAEGYPKPVHKEFPTMMCNLTAVTRGVSEGRIYMAVGSKIYVDDNGSITDKGNLCHAINKK